MRTTTPFTLSFLITFVSIIQLPESVDSATLKVPQDYATVQMAVAAATSGDTVEVTEGSYNCDLGASIGDISLIGVGNLSRPSLTNTYLIYNSGQSSTVSLSGFKISGKSDFAVPIVMIDLASSPTISDNIISSLGPAIQVQGAGSEPLIAFNVFDDCFYPVTPTAGTKSRIINNTFYNNLGGVVSVLSDSTIVKNNIFVECAGSALYGSGIFNSNNLFWNNDKDYDNGATAGPGELQGNPLFLNSMMGFFRILAGSPAIDAGDPDVIYNDPDGSRNDMGAFPHGCCDVPGDADRNGSFNIADVSFGIARIFGGGPAPLCQDQADSNADGVFHVADVVYNIDRIFLNGPAPNCGPTGL